MKGLDLKLFQQDDAVARRTAILAWASANTDGPREALELAREIEVFIFDGCVRVSISAPVNINDIPVGARRQTKKRQRRALKGPALADTPDPREHEQPPAPVKHKAPSHTEEKVLEVLAAAARAGERCPTVEKLAARAGTSYGVASTAMAGLIRKGHVKVLDARHRVGRQIAIPALDLRTAPLPPPGRRARPASGEKNRPPGEADEIQRHIEDKGVTRTPLTQIEAAVKVLRHRGFVVVPLEGDEGFRLNGRETITRDELIEKAQKICKEPASGTGLINVVGPA